MCRPPPANPLHVAGPLEVVGVARLPQPAGLALLFAHPPARGRRTVALAPPVPGVRNKGRVAMQALGVRGRSSHRLEEDASPTPNPTHPLPEKPQGRKKRRRKKRLRPIRKKTPRKNTPPHPVFKPPTSSGFQLGADTLWPYLHNGAGDSGDNGVKFQRTFLILIGKAHESLAHAQSAACDYIRAKLEAVRREYDDG